MTAAAAAVRAPAKRNRSSRNTPAMISNPAATASGDAKTPANDLAASNMRLLCSHAENVVGQLARQAPTGELRHEARPWSRGESERLQRTNGAGRVQRAEHAGVVDLR